MPLLIFLGPPAGHKQLNLDGFICIHYAVLPYSAGTVIIHRPSDLRKILHGGQRMASVHSGEEILPKGSTP